MSFIDPVVRSAVVCATLLGFTGQALAATTPCLVGLNLSGAEYGDKNGIEGTNFFYPTEPTVGYFSKKGMNTVRLPFNWDRLQPQLNAALDGTELQRLKDAVARLRAHGMTIILDPHNFGYYAGKRIGTQEVPDFAFADFWTRLSIEFANQDDVVFGLMNEPYDILAVNWLKATNGAIAGIRAVKAGNLILVQGTRWSGAGGWEQEFPGGSNGTVMLGVRDPAENYAYEVHQYMDADYSGTKETCVNAEGARQALVNFTTWLRNNGKRGFLGEFGGSQEKDCLSGLKGMTGVIRDNADVWLGWSYWAGGDWWGPTEGNNIQPTPRGDRKQLAFVTDKAARTVHKPGSCTRSVTVP